SARRSWSARRPGRAVRCGSPPWRGSYTGDRKGDKGTCRMGRGTLQEPRGAADDAEARARPGVSDALPDIVVDLVPIVARTGDPALGWHRRGGVRPRLRPRPA